MPAPELTPQVPGETPKADDAPTSAPNPEIAALLAQDDIGVIAALPELSTDALRLAGDAEAAGENRESVLLAIADEIEARNLGAITQLDEQEQPGLDPLPPLPPALTRAAPSDEPVRVDTQPRPVLTDAGWVVPEPLPNAQPQVR